MFLCPFCRHHKPKLSVNLDTDEYNCWTCPDENRTRGRSLTRLLRVGCSGEEVAAYAATLPEPGALRPRIVNPRVPPTLPVEFEPVTEIGERDVLARQYVAYLRSRGVTESLCALYRVGICRSGRYSGRVVFPSFDSDGELEFLSGRAVDREAKFPHLTCEASKDVVGNEWLVDWAEPVVLVEGAFDAVVAGTNAIPLYGTIMLDRLFYTLTERCERVYIALDEDAYRKQLEIGRKLFRHQLEVMMIDLGGKDPSAVGREAFARARDSARPYDEMTRIRGRLAAHSTHL